jgi:predicted lipid-binding transport protein (Tim44 family)
VVRERLLSVGADASGDFDLGQFSAQLRAAFFTTKLAWSQLKPEICRHVMTEDLWADQKARMEAVRLDGSRNVISDLIISRVQVAELRTVGLEDEVSARLLVAGTEYIVKPATNQVMTGSAQPDQWIEDWVLRRSRDPAVLAEARNPSCPNCGAPVHVDSEGRCTFCRLVVPGAKSDWLVRAIDRPAVVDTTSEAARPGAISGEADEDTARAALVGEYAAAAPLAAPAAASGISAIQAHDPDFSVGDVVAEARELFFNLEQSRTMMDPSAVRPYLSDALWQAEVARADAALRDGRHQVRAFLDIKSVLLVGAGSDGGGDRLVIRVGAQSADHLIDTWLGRVISGDNQLGPWTEDLVLTRRPGLVSDPLRGIQVHDCPSCGAPLDVTADGTCRACGRHVTAGEFDWILSEIQVPPSGGGEPVST